MSLADEKYISFTTFKKDVVVTGAEFDAVHAKIREKYGFQLTLINAFHSVQRLLRRGGHDNNCAVITTLDES